MKVSIQVTGGKKALAALKRTKDGMLDLRGPMRDTGRLLAAFYSGEVFASRGRVIGQPWAKLSESTARYKDRLWPGRPTLVRTGKLQNGFQFQSGATFVRIFNDVPYFKYHQSAAPRRRLPRRVMMGLDNARVGMIVELIDKHLKRQIAGR